jgi:hypothetical protein
MNGGGGKACSGGDTAVGAAVSSQAGGRVHTLLDLSYQASMHAFHRKYGPFPMRKHCAFSALSVQLKCSWLNQGW